MSKYKSTGIVSILIMFGFIYYFFFRDEMIIRQVNQNLQVNGIKLLQSEKETIEILGVGKHGKAVTTGHSYTYDHLGLMIGYANNKVIEIRTDNPSYSFMGIRVGGSITEARKILKKNSYRLQPNGIFKKGEIYILIEVGKNIEESNSAGNISSLNIWFLDKKYKNTNF